MDRVYLRLGHVKMLTDAIELLRAPSVLSPKRHLFLFSHMRAFTSLFGHILGSNPAICGYYEMHMGYHSWKSLLRQKLVYFKEEKTKPGYRYQFDKILHNEHEVSASLLEHARVDLIFSLRHPEKTLPSIVKLYASVDPEHEFNSMEYATRYYIQRLEGLQQLAQNSPRGFFYFDAETLRQSPNTCLGALSQWLELETSLSTQYDIQQRSAQPRYGDTSEALKSGQISTASQDTPLAPVAPDLLASAVIAYTEARETLIKLSALNCLLADGPDLR